jgi:nitrate reductase NapAB chaperone NapD
MANQDAKNGLPIGGGSPDLPVPAGPTDGLYLTGILVRARPSRQTEAVQALAGMEGVDVHHQDAAAGKIVVTLEARSLDEAIRGLRRIQAHPSVYLAEPVYHYVEGHDA